MSVNTELAFVGAGGIVGVAILNAEDNTPVPTLLILSPLK